MPPGGPDTSTSDKTMVHAAIHGYLIRVGDLRGYLCGMDSFHWKIVDEDDSGHIALVHKSVPVIHIFENLSLWDDEDDPAEETEAIRKMVAPFRAAMRSKKENQK